MKRQLPILIAGLAALFASAALAKTGRDTAVTDDVSQALHQKPAHGRIRQALMQRKLSDRQPSLPLAPLGPTPCVGGNAAGFPCRNVDLESFLPIADIGGGETLDLWGWTDPIDGKEYALVGRTTGTSFVDVSVPGAPIYLGDLPTHASPGGWRDIKVYADHAFIVADWAGVHGMQVFDLTQLRSVTAPPVTFIATAHYAGFEIAHNIVIDEAAGFAYAVGSNTCSGGLHMIDIQNPLLPIPAGVGCVDVDGYTHDAQCVIYAGPDPDYAGREVCFAFNGDSLTIYDVTDKLTPLLISRTPYSGSGYAHQGWLSDNQALLVMDDEYDELIWRTNTRTHFWNVRDLDAPVRVGIFQGTTPAIDHNLYILGNHIFMSNYRAGLRIVDMCCDSGGGVEEVAYFDVYAPDDEPNFNGSWSNYPYFRSGIVIVSGIEQGLFVVRPTLPPSGGACFDLGTIVPAPELGGALRAVRAGDDVVIQSTTAPPAAGGMDVFRSLDRARQGASLSPPLSTSTDTYVDAAAASDGALYYYQIRAMSGCGLGGL